jgi:hypothetical protein
MKQTAVEWLVEQICGDHTEQWQKEIDQAKEMEKEQIIDAWINGALDTNAYTDFAEQYYNQTFKSK